jgi:hypothetical protein
MHRSLEVILGILERESSPCVAQEDFDGPHGEALRLWQDMGFLARESGSNPVPGCPYCGDGVPQSMQGRLVCNRCGSVIDAKHLLLWPFDLPAFLRWLASQLKLRGGVTRAADRLWQLGRRDDGSGAQEWFFQQGPVLTRAAQQRLSAYRNVVVLYCLTPPAGEGIWSGSDRSLLQFLRLEETLTVCDPAGLLRSRGGVRFEGHSGSLWVEDRCFGEIPVGSREFYFLERLARELDRFVPYADIKHSVLQRSGCSDSTEEATFCHKLKRRIKAKWLPDIDRFVATTNKAEGYRLRGYVKL